MTATDIQRIRAFNRAYVTRLGLFARDYVGMGYSVSEFRILKEFMDVPGISAREVSNALDIDEGQVSRTVKRFIDKGWLTRKSSNQDARRKTVALTAQGRENIERVHQRVNEKTRERLGDIDIVGLADQTDEILRRLGQLPPPPLEITDLTPGDAGWVVTRHAEFYNQTQGFDLEFDALVMEILAEYISTRDPDRTRAFVARQGRRRVGSIFCAGTQDPDLAQLRLFFVEPDTQGQGVGKRLLEECLIFARQAGYGRMRLMTSSTQTTARALYARFGFRCVDQKTAIFCGQEIVEEDWQIAL